HQRPRPQRLAALDHVLPVRPDEHQAPTVAPTPERRIGALADGVAGEAKEHLPDERQQRCLARLVRPEEDGQPRGHVPDLDVVEDAEPVDVPARDPHGLSRSSSRSTASAAASPRRSATSAASGIPEEWSSAPSGGTVRRSANTSRNRAGSAASSSASRSTSAAKSL